MEPSLLQADLYSVEEITDYLPSDGIQGVSDRVNSLFELDIITISAWALSVGRRSPIILMRRSPGSE